MTSVKKITVQLIRKFDKFLKYNLVGIFNTLLTLTIIYILQQIYSVNSFLSNFIGYILGIILSFTLNSIWTFKKTDDKLVRGLKFLFVFFIAYGVNILMLGIFLDLFENLNKFIPHIFAAVFYSIVGFLLNKNYVFIT
jgi:putative flippase GtrA